MGLTPRGGKSSQGLQFLNAVRQGLVRAERYVRNPKELLRLLTAAERRLDRINAGPLTPFKRDLQTLLRMLRASGEGRYQQVSKRNLVLAGLGVLYLVSPLDLIPDFLPGGFADDAAIIAFVLKKVRGELVAFEAWERGPGA
jgi:uncharacterized membrane protein YkvA (DUF1232 family)